MRLPRTVMCAALVLSLIGPVATQAQETIPAGQSRPVSQLHVADRAALDRLMIEQTHRDARDREAIKQLLAREEVRKAAHEAGIDMTRADAAVSTLGGAELHQLATQARQAEEGLEGGASTIVISTTTIIIILLVVILIVVAAD
jgi:hypothetical protein